MIGLLGVRVVFYQGTPDERVALDDLQLSLAEGSFAVVVGTNGAGKSTLLNVVAGTVSPQRGKVTFGDTDIASWPPHQRAKFVSRVFQDPMLGTCAALTIEENLALAERRGQSRGLSLALKRSARERYRELLAPFGLGLETRMGASAGLLSGGQRQVLALLMATLSQPDLLLLDEHTAALDPRTAQLVIDASVRLIAEQRITTLMITHNMQHAIDCGDRLLMMESGRIKLDIGGAEKRGLTIPGILQRFGDAPDFVQLQAAGDMTSLA